MGKLKMASQIAWSLSMQFPTTSFLVVLRFSFLNSHISPFLFTKTLLPLMEKTAKLPDAGVRIVNVYYLQLTPSMVFGLFR